MKILLTLIKPKVVSVSQKNTRLIVLLGSLFLVSLLYFSSVKKIKDDRPIEKKIEFVVDLDYYTKHVIPDTSNTNLLYVQGNGGQMANQLWPFAKLLCFAWENGYSLYNPSFYRYAEYFEYFHDDKVISPTDPIRGQMSHVIRSDVDIEYEKALANIPADQIFDTNALYFKPIIFSPMKEDFPKLLPKVYIFRGWLFENDLEKYRDKLIEIFRPRKKYEENIDQFWHQFQPEQVKISVHIRRGDYRVYLNGVNYFTNDEYHQFILKIANKFKGYNPVVIIHSDEDVELNEFPHLQVYHFKGNRVEDLYSLSRGDIIIGPVSTYNAWAAWYGKRPLININRKLEISEEALNQLFQQVINNKKFPSP